MNCLDAETLAAWFDGGLSGAALEAVQSHVADCARCQALAGAMGHTRVAVPTPPPERAPRWWLAWAVPAAAAATAVAIWVAVPRPANVGVNPPSSSLQKQEAPAAQGAPTTSTTTPRSEPAAPPATPPAPARARAAAAAPPLARDSSNDVAQQAPDNVAETLSAQAATSAASPAERRETAAREGGVAGQIQPRAAAVANGFCGPMWPAPPADIAGEITAGSAPSGDICWIVGRRGAVLRSTDHRTWQRLNFPLAVDLATVNASDLRSATIVTADGRTFSTADGGVSWTQR